MAKAIAAVEELKVFLVCDSAEKLKKRLDKLFMVLILQSFHSDYDHVHEQILSRDQIPSMNSLVARLLYVPTLVKSPYLQFLGFRFIQLTTKIGSMVA